MLLNVKNGKYSINNSKSEDVCLLCFPSNSQVWYGYKGLYSTQIKRLYLTVWRTTTLVGVTAPTLWQGVSPLSANHSG